MESSEAHRRELLREAMVDLQQHLEGRKQLKTFVVSTEPDLDISAVLKEIGYTHEQMASALGLPLEKLMAWDRGEETVPREFMSLLSLLDIFSDEADIIFEEIKSSRRM